MNPISPVRTSPGGEVPRARATSEPAPAEPKDVLIRQLQEENRRLRAELDTGPAIRLDTKTNRLEVRNLEGDVQVERLKARLPRAGEAISGMLDVERLVQGKLDLSELVRLGEGPVTVEEARLRIPQEAATRVAELRGGEALREEGIRDLQLRFQPGDRLEISGKLHRLVDIPFDVSGKLDLTPEGQVRCTLEDTAVFGIIPVPRVVTAIAASLAEGTFDEMSVRRDGDAFLFDPQAFLPDNVRVRLSRLETREGALVVEGRAPSPPPPPKTLLAE